MSISFRTKFISAVAVLSIGITSFAAAPARAGDRDAERALAAILGLAVIGAVIADKQKDDRRKREQRNAQTVTRNVPTIQARPLPNDLRRHNTRKLLPQQCLRSIETNRGTARYYGARCMNKSFQFVNQLPRNCERRINTNRGVRYGWSARCLRHEGYTLARR